MDSPRSGCPINAAVEAFGDRWSLIVLRDMIFGGRRHFRELLTQSDEGIASNILADRLHKLVDGGLLTRDDPGAGRKATYSLTEASIELVPVLAVVGSWGLRHRPGTPELRVRAQLMEDGGPKLWERFMAELRHTHLGAPKPRGRSVSDEMREAYERALTPG